MILCLVGFVVETEVCLNFVVFNVVLLHWLVLCRRRKSKRKSTSNVGSKNEH